MGKKMKKTRRVYYT
jgi:hypothetical protein